MENIDSNFIESLLFEEEDSSLDFKREQYEFEGKNDHIKSELLKDILAFSNSWARTDRYILIGVEEIKGGKSIVHEIKTDLDDATLQQFVNSKTYRPINFSYKAYNFDDKKIGIITIPIQERPNFLNRNYGKLTKDTVYIRRGSSTAEARPDEVSQMKSSGINLVEKIEPYLEVYFRDSKNNNNTSLTVHQIEPLNRGEILESLKSIQISLDIVEVVRSKKEELNEITEQLPDGTVFHPYAADYFFDYVKRLTDSISLLEDNFDEFERKYHLETRAIELAKPLDNQKKYKIPTYLTLNIFNSGHCPAENMIIYINSDPKIKFLEYEKLREITIPFSNKIPDRICKIIDRAKLDTSSIRGYRPPVIKRPRLNIPRSPSWFTHSQSVKVLAERHLLTINIDDKLMHNHNYEIKEHRIYLCPFLKKGETATLEYECHADNLPEPTKGTLLVKGV